MGHVLADRHARTLAEFACSNVLLAFDYDGTLAPPDAKRTAAGMRRSTRNLLGVLAVRYPCVVISARPQREIARRLGAIPVFQVMGHDGLESWSPPSGCTLLVRRWLDVVRLRLDGEPGLVIEDRACAITIHHHDAPDRRRALAAIARAVRGLSGMRRVDGAGAVTLVPRGAPTKGDALERVRRLLACEAAIYVGDDDSDEDVFRAGRRNRWLAIRIGARRGSAASYRLANQVEIDAFMRALVEFRPGDPRRAAALTTAMAAPARHVDVTRRVTKM